MLEATLYNPLVKGALSENWLLFRIADGSYGKKPFDIAGCAPNGRAVAVEVKVVKRFFFYQPMKWHLFEQHQVGWLTAFSESGGIALPMIYSENTQKLYAFHYQQALHYRNLEEWGYTILERTNRSFGIAFVGWSQILRDYPAIVGP